MRCFYVPGARSIIDVIDEQTGRSRIYGETLEEIRARAFKGGTEADYSKAEVWDFDAAADAVEAASRAHYVHGPVAITKERFETMLDIMPPDDWQHGLGGESFKLVERLCGSLTAIFARLPESSGRNHYFEMCDDVKLSHQEILKRCHEALQGMKEKEKT